VAVFVEETDAVTPSRKLRIRDQIRTKRIYFCRIPSACGQHYILARTSAPIEGASGHAVITP